MKKALALGLSAAMCCTVLAGCGTPPVVSNPQTCSVFVYRAGFGISWLEKLAANFNKMYEEEGYTVIIEKEGTSSPSDIQLPKRNKTDLYFTTNSVVNGFVDMSRTIYRDNDTLLLEDFTELINSKAINGNKEEEGKTIYERLQQKQYFETYATYTGLIEKWQGIYFGLPWANAPTGVFVNVAALEEATNGEYSEANLPKTTDDFVRITELSRERNAKVSENEKIYANVYAGTDAWGYWSYLYNALQAQYSGIEAYYDFYSCTPKEGTLKDNGWSVYEDPAILKALEVMEDLIHDMDAPAGSSTKDIIAAQDCLYTGEAVYMVNGNWIYNEMVSMYEEIGQGDLMDDVIMVRTPVISALGTKLGISEETLKDIIDLVDAEVKTDAEIAQQCNTTEAVVAEIRAARSIYFSLAQNFNIAIPSYADGKEVAKLFVRYMLSDDGMLIYAQETNSSLPYEWTDPSKATDLQGEKFFQSVNKVVNASDATMIDENYNATIRSVNGLRSFAKIGDGTYLWPKFAEGGITSANKVFSEQIDFVKENWDKFCRTAQIF